MFKSSSKGLLLLIMLFCGYPGHAQTPAPNYPFIASGNYVQAKNYYLLTLIEQDKAVNMLLQSDAVLAKLAAQKTENLKASLKTCKNAACLTAQGKFSDEDIKQVSNRLTALYHSGNPLDRLVKTQLIPSGTYGLINSTSPVETLVKAWEQDAASINYTIDVYANGKNPNYPLIDSISFKTASPDYFMVMYDCASVLVGQIKNSSLFFEPALHAALLYLEINGRNNAADDEPMASTVNKAAVDQIKTTKWPAYHYSHILVPGAGPDEPETALSAEGMLRCRLAAQQYHAGAAPFIIVSGGRVHPYKTRYNEAEEMKSYLIRTLHISPAAVIIEPHARHTTTNMRNCTRLLYRYGFPAGKPGVVITNKSQMDFMMGMDARCEKELNTYLTN